MIEIISKISNSNHIKRDEVLNLREFSALYLVFIIMILANEQYRINNYTFFIHDLKNNL